jgi:hypothetical protein
MQNSVDKAGGLLQTAASGNAPANAVRHYAKAIFTYTMDNDIISDILQKGA